MIYIMHKANFHTMLVYCFFGNAGAKNKTFCLLSALMRCLISNVIVILFEHALTAHSGFKQTHK